MAEVQPARNGGLCKSMFRKAACLWLA